MTRTDADDELVTGLLDAWESLRKLAAQLHGEVIDRPTRVPGWTIRDNYSHMIASQLFLLGRPEELAPVDPAPSYVRNDLGRKNEAPVEVRRASPGDAVLEEFSSLSTELSPRVGAMSTGDLDTEIPTGHGVIPRREMMSMILMDNWIHEQDIRAAAGLPGHHSGPAVVHSRNRMLRRIAGRLTGVEAIRSTSVAFRVLAPAARRVVLRDGVVQDDDEAIAEVEVVIDAVVLAALAGGRVEHPRDAAQLGVLELEGNVDLGEIVLAHVAFTS